MMGLFEMTDELALGDIFAHGHHGMYMNSHFGCLEQEHSASFRFYCCPDSYTTDIKMNDNNVHDKQKPCGM